MKTDFGEFLLHTYRDHLNGDIHFALVKGEIDEATPTLVRVHLAARVRDLFCTQPADQPGWNMYRSLERLSREKKGVVVLLANPERPDDILHSVDIALGRQPAPSINLDRSSQAYLTVGLGSQILRDIGVGKILLMGAPVKYNALSGFDLEVVDFVAPE